MKKTRIRGDYDHPEHHRDKIEEYTADSRHIPTPLGDLLLEQAGHRCTICKEPYFDLHHINPIENGGMTEYDNLIVLCPNCHRRVHKENIPNPQQLRHYKLKLEIAYELPIIGRLSNEEKILIKYLSQHHDSNELVLFKRRYHKNILNSDHGAASRIFRIEVGYLNLEKEGIISAEYGNSIGLADETTISVEIFIRITSKGIKWIEYLNKSNKLSLLD